MCVLYLLHIYSVCSQHQSLMFNTCSREVTSWSFLLSKKADFLITVISSSSKPRAKCKTSLESWKSFFNGRKARKHGTRFWGWQWLAQRLRQCREHDWGTGRDYETCRRGPTCGVGEEELIQKNQTETKSEFRWILFLKAFFALTSLCD